jgi:hypothetical protein
LKIPSKKLDASLVWLTASEAPAGASALFAALAISPLAAPSEPPHALSVTAMRKLAAGTKHMRIARVATCCFLDNIIFLV